MQQAPYLQEGDSVTILSTARKISREDLQASIDLLTRWGLKVTLADNLQKEQEHHQFAGTVAQRTASLQKALDDPNCKAIICARGGYGTIQLIDALDFTQFKQQPKWIVGYSDVTVLHNHINRNFDLESLHATMPVNFPASGSDEATESLRKALFGEEVIHTFELETESKLTTTALTAPLVGGNLSIIYSLTGTNSQLNTRGKWLFIEDLDEYLYHIDRMMMNLKRAGLFKDCAGILVGGMSDMNDNAIPYGQTAKEIILHQLNEYNIPVLFGVPAGHIKRNLALIMNRSATVSISEQQARIQFHGRA